MNTFWRTFATAAVAALLCSVANTPSALSADKEAAAKVSVEDIGTKVVLVGRLGEPLGTMMDVKGTWAIPREAKDSSPLFQVSHVNGKELAGSVQFHIVQITAETKEGKPIEMNRVEDQKKLDGVTWTLRAYETGTLYTRIPAEYYKETGKNPPPAVQRAGRMKPFRLELVGVLQK